jgi:hypothetical protein
MEQGDKIIRILLLVSRIIEDKENRGKSNFGSG